jgi:hypothetical protein
VAATYVSASEAARIGGDLYDAVASQHGLRMVIGDVRGKGLDAVRLAASALGAFREAVHREDDLQRVAAAMHDAVRRDAGPEDFVTAVLVEVRGEVVRMLGCGHPHPLRLRAGEVRELELPEALPLGLGAPGPAVAVDVQPGDRVLLFTDGAVEARRAGRFFPLQEAVRSSFASHSLLSAVEDDRSSGAGARRPRHRGRHRPARLRAARGPGAGRRSALSPPRGLGCHSRSSPQTSVTWPRRRRRRPVSVGRWRRRRSLEGDASGDQRDVGQPGRRVAPAPAGERGASSRAMSGGHAPCRTLDRRAV